MPWSCTSDGGRHAVVSETTATPGIAAQPTRRGRRDAGRRRDRLLDSARGDDARDEGLAGLECDRARCDLLDRRAVRRALEGVDRVFHSAGLVSLRAGDDAALFRVNVDATRLVLEEC